MIQPDGNHPLAFLQLSPSETRALIDWIKANFKPIKTANKNYTSYGLKHIFEKSECGFYITNGMFKGAMLQAGFDPVDKQDLNWVFCISQKSPALKRRG